jgi:hypothetical protein
MAIVTRCYANNITRVEPTRLREIVAVMQISQKILFLLFSGAIFKNY